MIKLLTNNNVRNSKYNIIIVRVKLFLYAKMFYFHFNILIYVIKHFYYKFEFYTLSHLDPIEM